MDSVSNPEVVEDFLGLLKLYSDGSVYRSKEIPFNTSIREDSSIVWKDCLYSETHNLYLRLYKPKDSKSEKLPIVYYLHAGGFCFGSRVFPDFHNTCLSLCSKLHALVVAPDHRLAPEHRLPSAIDDVHAALEWLQDQATSEEGEPWLSHDEVGFDRVFIIGESSGGNLAHQLSVRLGAGSSELEPVRVRGYVLLSPFFGGLVWTKSEEERPSETFWNMDMYDRFWRLSLPEGATKDHPLANPLSTLEGTSLDPMLVVVGGKEILRDRVEQYANRLKELGKNVSYVEFEGKEHGFFINNSYNKEAENVTDAIKHFMCDIAHFQD